MLIGTGPALTVMMASTCAAVDSTRTALLGAWSRGTGVQAAGLHHLLDQGAGIDSARCRPVAGRSEPRSRCGSPTVGRTRLHPGPSVRRPVPRGSSSADQDSVTSVGSTISSSSKSPSSTSPSYSTTGTSPMPSPFGALYPRPRPRSGRPVGTGCRQVRAADIAGNRQQHPIAGSPDRGPDAVRRVCNNDIGPPS